MRSKGASSTSICKKICNCKRKAKFVWDRSCTQDRDKISCAWIVYNTSFCKIFGLIILLPIIRMQSLLIAQEPALKNLIQYFLEFCTNGCTDKSLICQQNKGFYKHVHPKNEHSPLFPDKN